jgi:hypothetical protein
MSVLGALSHGLFEEDAPSSCDYPATGDVRYGTEFGYGSYIGTLAVPNAPTPGGSTSITIANSIVATIQSLSGAPANVFYRKVEVWHPTAADGVEGVCVSGGLDTTTEHAMDGNEYHEYAYQIAYFKPVLPPGIEGDDVNPSFFNALKAALATTTLVGVPVVWDYEIAARSEWEGQYFTDGVEVSRLGVLYRTNEAT